MDWSDKINLRVNRFASLVLFSQIILSVLSCGGLSDTVDDLGEGYYHVGEGKPMNYIFISHRQKNGISIDTIVVYPCVDTYEVDEKYIVIAQSPSIEAIKTELSFLYQYGNEKIDSVFGKNKNFSNMLKNGKNYWIILKDQKKVLGPLTKYRYLIEGENYHIPSEVLMSIIAEQ